MKIIPCIVGLGYVGLPIALALSKKFFTYGFDINNERIKNLKKKIDINNEFNNEEFKKLKKINFTNKVLDIQRCNFFILCVPTPKHKNKTPDLRNLTYAIKIISKILKKNDIIFIESTVHPGITEKCKNILEKKTRLKNNKDFFIGYSPSIYIFIVYLGIFQLVSFLGFVVNKQKFPIVIFLNFDLFIVSLDR